jgi:PAS domain S-box-containing protein
MESPKIRVLLVEDNDGDARLIHESFAQSHSVRIALTRAARLDDALAKLRAERFDVMLLDLTLPDARGLDTLRTVRAVDQTVPIVVLTGLDAEETGVQAVKEGAQDYLVKGEPASLALIRTIRHAIERQQVDSALRASVAELRTMAEAMPQIVWITDAVGRNVYFNRRWMAYTGLTAEESLGEGWIKPFHPEDAPHAIAAWKKATTENAVYSIESRLRRADGTYRWWLMRGVPLTDDSGQILKWYGTCTDIDDLKQAELKIVETNRVLSESEENYRHLFDGAPDPIIIIDPVTRDIVDANRVAERVYGYTRSELIGQDAIILSNEPAASKDSMDRAAREDTVLVPRREHRRKDGSLFPTEIHYSFFIRGGRRMLVAVIRDISSRVAAQRQLEETESQLRQAQKMESMGRLAGGVAHDFNNILTAILGLSELSINALPAGDRVREDVEEIRRSALRAASLTQQLLVFSRRQVVAPRLISVDKTVADLEKMLRRILGEHIELSVLPAASDAVVKADPGQIEQLVVNLSVNARDAMPQGGTLTIRTAALALDEATAATESLPPGRYAEIRVEDTGTGISDEVRKHLFEPFFTTKEQGKGTGLGLSTCYGITRQSGGAIQCASTVGNGTVFRVLLPCVAGSPEAAPTKSPKGDSVGTETILFVEDDASVRDLATRLLRRAGYVVVEASDGMKGLSLLANDAQKTIRIVLTDMVMPVMSGWEFAQRADKIRPGIPVVFITGYTDDTLDGLCMLDGTAQILPKPFTAETLTEKVRAVLDRAQS